MQGDSEGYNKESLLLVATLQTLLNTEIEDPKIVLIDEVHYAYESDYIQSLFLRFPKAIFIGLSATPTDDKNFLLDGFDTIIDDYQTDDLQKGLVKTLDLLNSFERKSIVHRILKKLFVELRISQYNTLTLHISPTASEVFKRQ